VNLYDVLRAHGHKVFLDQVTMAAGDSLISSIEEGLDRSRAGVLVWSSKAADSAWVRREYAVLESRADDPDFHFVPVRLDSEKLPSFAATRIFLDFSAYPDGPNGGELLRLLHAIVGVPLSDEALHFATAQDEIAARANNLIRTAIRNGSPKRLQELFEAGGLPWRASAALGCAAAEGLTKLGENEAALHMLARVEQQFPRAIRPRQLRALALARRAGDDDLETAQNILGELYEQGERDPETLGIYARTWMDRYAKSGNIAHLRRSRDLYGEAFDGAQDDYYTGINAAAKSVLLGAPEDLEKGRAFAERVEKIVGREPVAGDYWRTATIGEMLLMQRDFAGAGRLYAAAVAGATEERASHESSWKQACRLMEKLQPGASERALVREAFSHLPDCPPTA
jgi:TPR repeat protein